MRQDSRRRRASSPPATSVSSAASVRRAHSPSVGTGAAAGTTVWVQVRVAWAGVLTWPRAVLNCPPLAASPGVMVLVTVVEVFRHWLSALTGQITGTVMVQPAAGNVAPVRPTEDDPPR